MEENKGEIDQNPTYIIGINFTIRSGLIFRRCYSDYACNTSIHFDGRSKFAAKSISFSCDQAGCVAWRMKIRDILGWICKRN
jgi:hypothetical protein